MKDALHRVGTLKVLCAHATILSLDPQQPKPCRTLMRIHDWIFLVIKSCERFQKTLSTHAFLSSLFLSTSLTNESDELTDFVLSQFFLFALFCYLIKTFFRIFLFFLFSICCFALPLFYTIDIYAIPVT